MMRTIFAYGSVLAAVSALIYAAFLINKNTPRPSMAEVRSNPPTNPLVERLTAVESKQEVGAISGLGIIEPAGEAILIGSQLPGVVAEVLVTPGQFVSRNTPLFRLDSRTAVANVEIARANLSAQKAKLVEMQAQIRVQKARVEAALSLVAQAKSAESNANRELQRVQSIGSNNVFSQEELDLRRMNMDIAYSKTAEVEARYREALASLELLDGPQGAPSLDVQVAAVQQAEANLAKEQANLSLHTITAPCDATVLQVKVRAGEFAPAAVLTTPLMTLGVVSPLHIRVDIDESEIPKFDSSAKAFASVRGRPEVQVPIQWVRTEPYVIPKRTLTGNVSERVDTRVLQLIYSVSPDKIEATVGQQVDVYIEQIKK